MFIFGCSSLDVHLWAFVFRIQSLDVLWTPDDESSQIKPFIGLPLQTRTDSFSGSLQEWNENLCVYIDFRSKFSKQKIILDNDPTKCWTFYGKFLYPSLFVPLSSTRLINDLNPSKLRYRPQGREVSTHLSAMC